MFTYNTININLELLYGYPIDKLSEILLNIQSFDKLIPYCEGIDLIKNVSDKEKIMKFFFKIFWVERFGIFSVNYKKNSMLLISKDKDTFKKFGLTFHLIPNNDTTVAVIKFTMNVNNIVINKLMYMNRESITNNVINNLSSNLNEFLGTPSQELIVLKKEVCD